MHRIMLMMTIFSFVVALSSCTGGLHVREIGEETVVELPYEVNGDHGVDRSHPCLEVVGVALTNEDRLVDVRFRLYGVNKIIVKPDWTYLRDERSGKKIILRGKPRVGVFPPVKPKDGVPLSYIVFDNEEGMIERGSPVTVVINGMRLRHVIVQ